MSLRVVGAGVGRTGTNSLKLALEQVLGAPCHHMFEIRSDPAQIPRWIDAIEGRPADWSRSASNTIFPVLANPPAEMQPWMEAVRRLLRERFSDRFDDPMAMMDAFERHNAAVRDAIPPERLLEWSVGDGWEPICDRLGVDVPPKAFPNTNSTSEFAARVTASPT